MTADVADVQTAGTVIFDDATARADSLAPIGYNSRPDALAWGSTAATLNLLRYSPALPQETAIVSAAVSADGLAISSIAVDMSKYSFGRTFYAPGRAYDLHGYVLDASTGAALGQFPLPVIDPIVTLLPDPAHGQVFVLQPDGRVNRLYLLSYDASTFELQSVVNMGFDSFDVDLTTHLITWGTDGIAFNRNGVQILSGSFSAPPNANAGIHGVQHSSRSRLPGHSIQVTHAGLRSH